MILIVELFNLKKIVSEKYLKSVQSLGFDGTTLNEKCDVEKIRKFLEIKKVEDNNIILFSEITKSLDSLWTIFHHKELATRQRNSYHYMRDNLTLHDVFIVIDYKQKV